MIVKSGNMSMGVNLLAALVERARKRCPTTISRCWKCITATRWTPRRAPRCCWARRRPKGRDVPLDKHWVKSRDGHTGRAGRAHIGFATLRGGSVVGEHSVILAGTGERITLSHSAEDRAIFAHGALGRQVGPRQEARPVFDGRCFRSWSNRWIGYLVLVRHGQSEWNLKNLVHRLEKIQTKPPSKA